MNKWLMLVALVLMTLASAVGLRNLEANQTVMPKMANTGMPVPVMPPPNGLYANTGMPVPVMPPPTRKPSALANTGMPVPVMPPPSERSGL